MATYIGSKSTDTIIDVFKTGVESTINENGVPSELRYKTKGCVLMAQGQDLSKRVDVLKVIFPLKEGADPRQIDTMLKQARIGARIQVEKGRCTITVPPFEWKMLPHLLPLDKVVEDFAATSIRSSTWTMRVESFVSSSFNINVLIEEMEKRGASDLHLRAGNRPFIRVDNDLFPLDMPLISSQDMREFVLQLGGQAELDMLETERESSFQYHAAGVGYLRCSGYIKMGAMSIAIRLIPEAPVPFEKLNIPDTVKGICYKHRGLFLVCGITGSGKSTTLAAMIDHINERRKVHIITAEDPIEFVYRDKQSIVSQRQVGRDTFSFANALRGALREDPDVILVGEMRDVDTIRAGLSAAETGHLVFSTLHTTTAVDTVNRVITYFPQSERDLIRQELAYTLQGVVCQRLLRRLGGGRIPCVEVLLGGRPIVRDAIIDGDLEKLHGIMEVDGEMKTFDQYAVELYKAKKVSREEAISACSNEEGFERVISGIKTSEGNRLLG